MTAEQHIWAPDEVDRLRKLRADLISYSAIARQLGVTKNQALKQAHRLGLNGAAEANPIKLRDPEPVPTTTSTSDSARGCQWPMWPDQAPRPTMEFCGATRVDRVGAPYCAAHEKQASAGVWRPSQWNGPSRRGRLA